MLTYFNWNILASEWTFFNPVTSGLSNSLIIYHELTTGCNDAQIEIQLILSQQCWTIYLIVIGHIETYMYFPTLYFYMCYTTITMLFVHVHIRFRFTRLRQGIKKGRLAVQPTAKLLINYKKEPQWLVCLGMSFSFHPTPVQSSWTLFINENHHPVNSKNIFFSAMHL